VETMKVDRCLFQKVLSLLIPRCVRRWSD